MIIGAHTVITSKNPEADYAFLRDVLKLPYVDDGGYLIFAAPAAELSVHQADPGGMPQLHLQCKDVQAFVADMKKHGVACAPVQDQGWGLLTALTLPGGAKLSVYEPRHARPGAKAPKARRKARAKM